MCTGPISPQSEMRRAVLASRPSTVVHYSDDPPSKTSLIVGLDQVISKYDLQDDWSGLGRYCWSPNLAWWTETDLRTDFFHKSDTPLGLNWCSWLLTSAHTAWESTSASLLFCTSGQERVENLKISRGQLALYQEKRIKRQQTVSSARCKVLNFHAGFLLAWMPSYCRFKPIECYYWESVSVSVPQDKIRGSAIIFAVVRHTLRAKPAMRRKRMLYDFRTETRMTLSGLP